MHPKLKISKLTNLQDARYSAALGFDFISFSLERGSNKKLPATTIWNMVNWLDGPKVILEMNSASLEEISDLTFDIYALSFPQEEWNEDLLKYDATLILRANTDLSVSEINTILEAGKSNGKEILFELGVEKSSDLLPYHSLLSHLIVNFSTLHEARSFMSTQSEQPYGISFGEEAEEEPNLLNYEALDELVALYSDVHL